MSASWPKVRLDECCDIVSGATPSTSIEEFWNGDICWATPKDLSELEGAYITDTPRKITRAGMESCAASILPVGSVLFSSRAPIGYVAINTVPMATNQGFKSFVPNAEKIDAKFFYWWLRTNRTYMEGLGNGATFKEVSKAVVSRVEIHLPSLLEQRRIAEVLDRADALRTKRRAALAQLDSLTQSLFLDIFGDPAANPKGLQTSRLGDLCEVGTGSTPSRAVEQNFGGDIPWVKTTEINWEVIADTEEKLTAQGLQSSRCKIYPIGSIVVALYGQGKTRGRSAILGMNATTNQACGVLQPSDKYDPSFLLVQLKLSYQRLRELGRGGNQENLNLGLLSDFPVLRPPIQEQQEFARRVAAVERLKTAHRASLAELDALFASLQHRAFRGEL